MVAQDEILGIRDGPEFKPPKGATENSRGCIKCKSIHLIQMVYEAFSQDFILGYLLIAPFRGISKNLRIHHALRDEFHSAQGLIIVGALR